MTESTKVNAPKVNIGKHKIPDQKLAIDRLIALMQSLRDPDGGCPWDLEQDFKSIAPYTIEESYEVADAAARGDVNDLKEELGDLLLQVVFHAQMATEKNLFTFEDVAAGFVDKMVVRHPHVFGDATANTSEAVLAQWDEIKKREKATKAAKQQSILDDVPVNFPALMRAQKLQKKAASVGFEWPLLDQVLDKLQEEITELKEELKQKNPEKITEEFGDLLFVVVNAGRKMGVDCEAALSACNMKFYNRFNGIERNIKASNKDFKDYTLAELEQIWAAQKNKL